MLKRKNISILLMALFAFAMLFSGIEAMAATPVPQSCTFVDSNGTPSPYSLTVISDPTTGDFPIPVAGTSGAQYLWAYLIGGALSGTNQLTALEAVCSPDMGYSVLSGGQVIPPGMGDPTTGYGFGDYQDYVVRMAYSSAIQGLPANYNFLTLRAGDVKNTSIQLKAGKNTYYCQNIAGPACYVGQIGAITQRTIDLDPDGHPGVSFTVISKANGKVIKVVDENGYVVPPVPLSNDHDLSSNGAPLTYIPDGTILKIGDHSILKCYYSCPLYLGTGGQCSYTKYCCNGTTTCQLGSCPSGCMCN